MKKDGQATRWRLARGQQGVWRAAGWEALNVVPLDKARKVQQARRRRAQAAAADPETCAGSASNDELHAFMKKVLPRICGAGDPSTKAMSILLEDAEDVRQRAFHRNPDGEEDHRFRPCVFQPGQDRRGCRRTGDRKNRHMRTPQPRVPLLADSLTPSTGTMRPVFHASLKRLLREASDYEYVRQFESIRRRLWLYLEDDP